MNMTLAAIGKLSCISVWLFIKLDDKMFLYHEVVMKIKWDSCKIHNPGPQRKESSEDDAECDGNDDTWSYTLQKVNCVSQCDKSTTLFFFFKKIISYWPMVAPYIAEPLIFLPISGTKTNNKTNRPPKSRDSSLERALRKRRERSWGGHICTTRVGKNNNNNKPPSLTLCYF